MKPHAPRSAVLWTGGKDSALALYEAQDAGYAVITGDIDLVEGLPNFVRDCCSGLDVEVFMPLWQRKRMEVMRRVIDLKFEVVFTLVKQPWFTPDWLGRQVDLESLQALEKLHRDTGMDVCGENGEYHTMVLDGPMFHERLTLQLGLSKQTGPMAYLAVEAIHAGVRPPRRRATP